MRCGDCRHWLRPEPTSRLPGVCKRYPPTPFQDGGQAVPHVLPSDWCGEFKPKGEG